MDAAGGIFAADSRDIDKAVIALVHGAVFQRLVEFTDSVGIGMGNSRAEDGDGGEKQEQAEGKAKQIIHPVSVKADSGQAKGAGLTEFGFSCGFHGFSPFLFQKSGSRILFFGPSVS